MMKYEYLSGEVQISRNLASFCTVQLDQEKSVTTSSARHNVSEKI
jgi:hypothetical protein